MKVLVLLVLAAASARAGAPRERRSVLAGAPYPAAPLVSSYTTARQLPSYYVPESTHVTTASNTIYSVRVPVTYSTTYAQPSVRTTSYYHPTAYASYAPVASYGVPVASYAHGGSWGVAGAAGISSVGYADPWW